MATGLINMSALPPRVAFFGNNCKVLECLSSVSDIIAVFTRPDDGRDKNVTMVKDYSSPLGIPVFQPTKKELFSYTDFLQKADLDLIIVCGYKFIIPKEIFLIPGSGTINIHPSMLPRYRGQHVINWAIINGETETGVTLHFMDETLDTGDIIVQKAVPIDFEDSANDLHDRIYEEACCLLRQLLIDFSNGKRLERKSQVSLNATFFKPRKPEDGLIEWDKSSLEIYNLIRALSKPWPGAYTYFKGYKVVIWKAHLGEHKNATDHGKVINASDGYLQVSTYDGQIIITDHEIVYEKDTTEVLKFKKGDFFQ
ncbi:MAG: methionyl-tRNA formyltransferase [Methanolobus sp.]|uniref:methionyl-tRNA formyltransferase n=1 Tax=Methanolobus sp. TaxID=1874737 RepID=UPI0027322AA6|nr:methionyl-tRNA formyltransferase [Methanolobus sp.]MDP2216506.1 methionyl-tRNA formyltransferase [Methanolobus sp.]